MSAKLFVYLESCPSLDEMRRALGILGLNYKHTLPADERWSYPMHVFGCDDLRIVYHAGDPASGEAVIDTSAIRSGDSAAVRLQLVASSLARRFGGTVYDPHSHSRGAMYQQHELARAR